MSRYERHQSGRHESLSKKEKEKKATTCLWKKQKFLTIWETKAGWE